MWKLKSKWQLSLRAKHQETNHPETIAWIVGVGYMAGRSHGDCLIRLQADSVRPGPQARRKANSIWRTVAQRFGTSSSCSVVLSCYRSDEAVWIIYEGPDGVFANAQSRLAGHLTEHGVSRDSQNLKIGFRAAELHPRYDISGSTPAAENGC